MLGTLEPLAAEVFITAELERRRPKRADHLREKLALQELAARMADAPQEVLPRFVALAMRMTGGSSAGLSLYEEEPAPGVFRWHHLCGLLARFEGATTPRHHSPCGVTLDQAGPVLACHAERMYGWIADAGIVVPEVLLVPLYLGGQDPIGTLWIVAEQEGHFDGDHARLATELATFVGIALRMVETARQLRRALEEQETMTQEMGHRLKNLFAMIDGMVRLGARQARGKEELAQVLSGRLQALASASTLAGHGHDPATPGVTGLEELLCVILRPHEGSDPAAPRFTLKGPPMACGERAVTSLALVLHELATNAGKYGALAGEAGRVAIGWRQAGDELVLTWTERGGPAIAGPPTRQGFGAKLIENALHRQLGGTVSHDWCKEGLTLTARIPIAKLQA